MLRWFKRWIPGRGAAARNPDGTQVPAIPKERTLLAQALEASPQDPDLNYRMGMQYLDEGDAASALDHFHLSLHFSPADFRACAARVAALQKLSRPDEEGLAYREFLSVNPGHAGAAYALARWHYACAEYEEAVDLLQPLAVRQPVDREACNLLGLILGRELGQIDEGIRLLRQALKPDASWPEALSNLGWMLMEKGDYAQGAEMMSAVLMRRPEDHETRLALACMNLKRGEFEAGWRDYEARQYSQFAAQARYDYPRWSGEHKDQTLLVVGEQGFGDQIMFASCVGEAMQRCRHTVIECDPRLEGLFRNSFPQAQVCADAKSSAASIDVQIPMGSLPGLMRNRWEDFPEHEGYLRADPRRIEHWRSRLDLLGPGPKIGISWRGGVGVTRRHLRSLDIEQFLPILRAAPVKAISLQYGECKSDLIRLKDGHGLDLPHWQDALDDYAETAALVCALDLVVSVCTAVIHLAGALGRPVWVLVPAIAEWRYLHRGARLPWYPSARLYRQATPGDWTQPIERVASDMADTYSGTDALRH